MKNLELFLNTVSTALDAQRLGASASTISVEGVTSHFDGDDIFTVEYKGISDSFKWSETATETRVNRFGAKTNLIIQCAFAVFVADVNTPSISREHGQDILLTLQRVNEFNKAEKAEHIDACQKKFKADVKRELTKAQNAKVGGGNKMFSRDNGIDRNAELIRGDGLRYKSPKNASKQLEKANNRVTFKAKETYNSKGAVRGGNSGLLPMKKSKLVPVSELINKSIPNVAKFDMEGAIKRANEKAAKKCAKQALKRKPTAEKLAVLAEKNDQARAKARTAKKVQSSKEVNQRANDAKDLAIKPVISYATTVPTATLMLQPKGTKSAIIISNPNE